MRWVSAPDRRRVCVRPLQDGKPGRPRIGVLIGTVMLGDVAQSHTVEFEHRLHAKVLPAELTELPADNVLPFPGRARAPYRSPIPDGAA
jgi:hypothetical protein